MKNLKKKFDRYPHKDYEKEWEIVQEAWNFGYCTGCELIDKSWDHRLRNMLRDTPNTEEE